VRGKRLWRGGRGTAELANVRMLKKANLEIRRSVGRGACCWPSGVGAGQYPGSGWCRDYTDVRGCSWEQAGAAVEFERELLSQHAGHEGVFEPDVDEVELCEALMVFDVGVASTVIVLSAAGCLPYSSCNGGLLGDHHEYDRPQVVFFAPQKLLPVLVRCAEVAGAGIEDYEGGFIVYADDLLKMVKFAEELLRCREPSERARTNTSKQGD
jgi:hypothetical protein